jgi:hypothetical protein
LADKLTGVCVDENLVLLWIGSEQIACFSVDGDIGLIVRLRHPVAYGPGAEEPTGRGELLYAPIPEIGHKEVPAAVHGDGRRLVELARTRSW